jgi:hypothetical protein
MSAPLIPKKMAPPRCYPPEAISSHLGKDRRVTGVNDDHPAIVGRARDS